MDAIPDLKGDGISALLYAGNWHQISTGASYFAATGPASPLKHTWSLAIEEQFYLFLPPFLVLLHRFWPRRLPLVTLAVTLLSFALAVHEVQVFKPHRQVYELVRKHFGVELSQVSFQSSNRWDIAGAAAFGFRTVWINRSGAPDEYRDLPPGRILDGLGAL